jgi:hypothetical protein
MESEQSNAATARQLFQVCKVAWCAHKCGIFACSIIVLCMDLSVLIFYVPVVDPHLCIHVWFWGMWQKGLEASPKNRHVWQAWALFEAKQGNNERAMSSTQGILCSCKHLHCSSITVAILALLVISLSVPLLWIPTINLSG